MKPPNGCKRVASSSTFKLSFIDEGMNNDPTATALMDALADAIHNGMMSADFIEGYEQATDVKIAGIHNDTH